MGDATDQRRTVLYGRVSELSDGRSVDDQLTIGRRWATAANRSIVATLRDDGISASRFANGKTRPDWQKAIELISTGQTDDLWVWEVSRTSRDRPVWAALIATLIEANVKLVVDGKSYDPEDPDDAFQLDLMAMLGVRESGMTSKRVKRDTKSRAEAGRPHGALQFGYRKVVDPNTGATIGREHHPDQYPIAREIVRRALNKEPLRAIATDLNRRGIPGNRGGEWVGGNIRQWLLNPTVAGLRVYQGAVLVDVKATWPPIVTIAEHHKLKAMFSDPDRDKWRNSTAVKHLGSGIYRCGRDECDGTMRVRVAAGDKNAYTCRKCARVNRNQFEVDRHVERVLIIWLQLPDVVAHLAGPDDTEAQRATEEAVALQAEIDGLYADVGGGRLSRQALWSIEPQLRTRLADAEMRARPKWVPQSVFDVAGPDADQKWSRLVVTEKRKILDALAVVTILPAGFGRWKFNQDLIKVEWRTQAE